MQAASGNVSNARCRLILLTDVFRNWHSSIKNSCNVKSFEHNINDIENRNNRITDEKQLRAAVVHTVDCGFILEQVSDIASNFQLIIRSCQI